MSPVDNSKIFGLLGRSLGHSWSVPIHAALGCPTYRLIEIEPETLPAFLQQENLGGLNVTIPYKQTVLPLCDEVEDTARTIGSVNTLVRRNGKLMGYNTDAVGFQRMAARTGISFAGKKVLVLGSGGASRTVQAVTKAQGAREVVVISRTGPDNYANLADRHGDADILVNATPVGMYPHNGACRVDLRDLPRCSGVLDLIYNPRRTALLMQAESLGIPCSDGLPMLVAQAVAAEERFFDRTFPADRGEPILKTLRKTMTNLVLIGMPGCGKTTVGHLLAEQTGREALDLDTEIERRAGCSIPTLFAERGEAAFRALERQVAEDLGKRTGVILMTGGGVVKDPRNAPALRQNGRVYHLVRDLNALPVAGRPLSQSDSLSALWAEREPLYRQFRDVAIDNNGPASETATAIWRDFCAHFGD